MEEVRGLARPPVTRKMLSLPSGRSLAWGRPPHAPSPFLSLISDLQRVGADGIRLPEKGH